MGSLRCDTKNTTPLIVATYNATETIAQRTVPNAKAK
jgi:hypothetical protein